MTRALWLPDVFRDEGLPIVVERGFETRGSADFDPEWIVEHHTASGRRSGNASALGICRDGRGGANPVAGPLCNWLTARDGTIHLVASGRANHAGTGSYPDGTTGNRRSYGNEAENDGIGEPWPSHQHEVIARADAALCRHHGWSADRVIGHKEYTRRKVDPTYDMPAHRRRVAELIRAGGVVINPTPPPSDQSEEDDMAAHNIIIVEGVGIFHEIDGLSSGIDLDDLVFLRAWYPHKGVKLLEFQKTPTQALDMGVITAQQKAAA